MLAVKEKYDQALKVLAALVQVAENAGDGYYLIQFLTLKAIILNKINQSDEAMTTMEKALSLAHYEGYVHSILDEGPEVESLLSMAIARGIEVDYAQKLLAVSRRKAKSISAKTTLDKLILEPLSQRELEVFRLLVTDLSAPEIADELVISASTVRSHIKNIYSKLDTHSRHEAVTRAKDLGIL